jgi:hypothetical protein
MKTLISNGNRHIWRHAILRQSFAKRNVLGNLNVRWTSSIGGEDGVDIKRTRNIGIIAHIDAVSIRICG